MCSTEKQIDGCFSAADILLPEGGNLQRWAVIACDQFTSQPEYWERVKALTKKVPSSYHLILPEFELDKNPEPEIQRIQETMRDYLQQRVFLEYRDCFIYTERTLRNGSVRSGLIGKIDLEQYDYERSAATPVRATEKTVAERIPPRMAIRRGAPLELPHLILFCDDERSMLIEPLREKKGRFPKLYDFELMLGGGNVAGWLITGEEKRKIDQALLEYTLHEQEKHPGQNLLFAVGDGNHSLATAKACYEELKQQNPNADFSAHPSRYALCELNNIHDPCQVFEPIHRVVKQCDAEKLILDLKKSFPAGNGTAVSWMSGGRKGVLYLPDDGSLPLSALQEFLDSWLNSNHGIIDYIHGEEALNSLEHDRMTVGFRLPPIAKESLFPCILRGGVLPRKTFSMGEAEEKRYYLEARRILP